MKCKNCKAAKPPATHSRAGRPLPDPQWYINTTGTTATVPANTMQKLAGS